MTSERDAEEDDADAEVAGEAAARREHERDEAADEAADSERGGEVADARVPGVEQLQRDEHEEDVQGPGDERLAV